MKMTETFSAETRAGIAKRILENVAAQLEAAGYPVTD